MSHKKRVIVEPILALARDHTSTHMTAQIKPNPVLQLDLTPSLVMSLLPSPPAATAAAAAAAAAPLCGRQAHRLTVTCSSSRKQPKAVSIPSQVHLKNRSATTSNLREVHRQFSFRQTHFRHGPHALEWQGYIPPLSPLPLQRTDLVQAERF
jgi:hypothetical protein